MSTKPAFVVAAALVATAVILGLSNPSAGQPKAESGLDERLNRIEKRLEQIEKKLEQLEKSSSGGRWQMQTLSIESVSSATPPTRYVSGSTVYLLDTQTGTLWRFQTGLNPEQLHPRK